MEIMDMKNHFGGSYYNRRVLVTGHTGFKGSWLVYWLEKLGADVLGYALPPNTNPNHFQLLDVKATSVSGDIRDYIRLKECVNNFQPEIVFHLAAQPLVRESYVNPQYTFETNIIGTVNVFEACRQSSSVKAIINVTSDKCYENKEWFWKYRENDSLGGHDPYSVSKACSELITTCYRKSFFDDKIHRSENLPFLASARAGNVIGGGDWSLDRLIPDLVKDASIEAITKIRFPNAVRPWQHVLEPLSGYLLLGWKLLTGNRDKADCWNFGPVDFLFYSVRDVINQSSKSWDRINPDFISLENELHEASFLNLDCSKSLVELNWRPIWSFEKAVASTIDWYKIFYERGQVNTEMDIMSYLSEAVSKGAVWT